MSVKEKYLGDGVYAGDDGHHIVLRADSGGQTNIIYLDPYVAEALIKYIGAIFNIKPEIGGD